MGETPPSGQIYPPTMSLEAPPCPLPLDMVHDGR